MTLEQQCVKLVLRDSVVASIASLAQLADKHWAAAEECKCFESEQRITTLTTASYELDAIWHELMCLVARLVHGRPYVSVEQLVCIFSDNSVKNVRFPARIHHNDLPLYHHG